MSRLFQRLSFTGAALTTNAVHPIPGQTPLTLPSFFAGWLTTELAPHVLALTAAGSAVHLARTGLGSTKDRGALAANAASAVALAGLAVQSQRAGGVLDRALTDDLVDPAPLGPTPWRQVLVPFPTRDPAVRRISDIPYVEDGNPRHLLDIYLPREGGRGLPVLLQIHGGGWVIGRKDQQGIPLMSYLAARGWICIAANYRLAPKARWPEQLVDLKRAVGWIRANVESYGGDPGFLAVTGGSAGGHLAAMLALTPNEPAYQRGFTGVDTTVQACVPHYGIYDVANTLGTRAGRQRLDHFLAPVVLKSRDPTVFERASPLLLVDEEAPPFFVVHGRHDSLVPVTEARAFVARLRTVSRSPVVYAELPGAQHAFDVFPSIRSAHVVRAVERFLDWVVAHRTVAPESSVPAGQEFPTRTA